MSRSKNLLEIWDLYSKQIIAEKVAGKKAEKMTTKPGPGSVQLNNPKAGEIGQKDSTGPHNADNFDGPAFKKNISDLKTMSDKDKKEKPYVANLNVSVENFDKNMEKNTKTIINNNMKSTFDKLFEEVMNSENDMDLQALGVDTEAGEGEAKEVTVTLSPEHVDALRAILAQIDGDGESEKELGDETTPDDNMGNEEDAEEDYEEMEEEDAEENAETERKGDKKAGEMNKEATEMEEVPDSAGQQLVGKGKMKVGDTTAKHDAGAGHAGTTTVSDEVDGKGKNVPDSHGHSLQKISNNKPKSKIKGGNQLAFGIK